MRLTKESLWEAILMCLSGRCSENGGRRRQNNYLCGRCDTPISPHYALGIKILIIGKTN